MKISIDVTPQEVVELVSQRGTESLLEAILAATDENVSVQRHVLSEQRRATRAIRRLNRRSLSLTDEEEDSDDDDLDLTVTDRTREDTWQ